MDVTHIMNSDQIQKDFPILYLESSATKQQFTKQIE